MFDLTKEEANLVIVALNYYIETLTRCSIHKKGKHGDEWECEGWGPKDYVTLCIAADKIEKARS